MRWLIITVAVVLGVAALAIAIGAIWLNSYIGSPAFKDEVEIRASASIGGPVQVESVDFDLLHGLKLRGLVTQLDANHTGGQGALKVNVAQVDCTYSFWDLLARKLRLTGVILDQPQITLTKQPTQSLPPAPASAPTDNSSTPASASGPGGSLPFQFVLDHARVDDGHVTVLDASGAAVVDLQGINANANTSGYNDGKDVTGSLKVAKIAASNLQVTSFSTPVTCHANYVSVKPFDATAFAGRLAGDFLMDGSGPSVLNLNANGLSVEQISAAANPGSVAHLTGLLDFQSKWRGIESGPLDGEGDAQLVSGKLENVKILHDIASILRINELSDPVITKGTTHFVAHGKLVAFNGLQLNSTLFNITGNGAVALNGALGADFVLVLSRDAMAKLPKELASSFVQQPDGTGSIAFHVSGTTSDPKTNLPERLLMQNTQIKGALDKALNKFFH